MPSRATIEAAESRVHGWKSKSGFHGSDVIGSGKMAATELR